MKNVVTFGELMLRLTPPGCDVILQTPRFEATFGGAEANVAVSLAAFGDSASFVTAFPDNDLGRAAVNELRRFGVDTSHIKCCGRRMGLYFTQTGTNMRASKVLYDRENTAVSEIRPGDIDWEIVLADADWFHVTGITPALSESLCETAIQAVEICHQKGITVSCDLNYRKNLWKWGRKAEEIMPRIVKYVDVLIANEEDCQKCLGINIDTDVESGSLDTDKYRELASLVMSRYPGIKTLAVSLRESKSATINGWSGILAYPDGFYVGPRYEITDIVDRIGGGDSFAGGLIYGLRNFDDRQKIIDFAVAASALKHTLYGDFQRATKTDVEVLISGGGNGRIQR